MIAVYSFMAGIAVSHDWEWFSLESTSPLFKDGLFVAVSRLATVLTPLLVGMCFFANLVLDALDEAI